MNSHWNLETGSDIMLQGQFLPWFKAVFWILLCFLHFWHSQNSQGFPVRHPESLRSFGPAQDPVLSTLQEVRIILSALLYSCLSSVVFLKTTVLVLEKLFRSKTCLLLILSSLSKCALTPARANSRYSINSCGIASSDQILGANSYLSKNINVLDDIWVLD